MCIRDSDVYLRIREVEIDVVGAVELDFHVLRTAAGDDVDGLVDVMKCFFLFQP